MDCDFKVKNLELAQFGQREIEIAEVEMPGLMAIRDEFGSAQVLSGARITGSLHMTIQTAVLIDTLHHLGANVRWCSCNIYSTQDHAAAAIAHKKSAGVFAWKGETLEEYWWCTFQALSFPGGQGPTLIVDDGGDATMFLIEGLKWEEEYEKNGALPNWEALETEDEREMMKLVGKLIPQDKGIFKRLTKDLVGVSEETTTGVLRLNQLSEQRRLPFRAINVNDSVTKSKFDNIYGCRHSLPDGIMRATDVMIAGKKVVICGYGDVGKGCASAMKGAGARVYVTEVDPICALQACMEGFAVVKLESIVSQADIFVTATGNKDIIMVEDMVKMKNNAIVGNIGHFDNEVDMKGLHSYPGVERVTIKEGTDRYTFPDGHGIIILAQGRLLNLGCATGHPSFVMSTSFTNQVLAQIDLWKHKDSDKYENGKVYTLSKELDEKVAALHLKALGAELSTLKPNQAEYLKMNVNGPFKGNAYRY